MTRKTTTQRKSRTLTRALAALAVVLGAGLISAAPARADHGPDVGFHFFFGLPFPPVPVFPVPVYEPPRYYQPRVVYEEPPVYYAPRAYYNERPHGYWRGDDRHWRGDDRHWRGGRDANWNDGRGHDRHHD
jgi:hypothetical protein